MHSTCQAELRLLSKSACLLTTMNTIHSLSLRTDLKSSKPTTRLAQEVVEAIEADPMHGPRQDRQRNQIGIEYEVLLEKCLKELGKFSPRSVCTFCSIHASYINWCHV